MDNQSDNENQKSEGMVLRLKRVQGEERQTYANNFVFQVRDDEFHIRFYQVSPPIVLGETEEIRKSEIEGLEGVIETPCVSHIVMTAGKLQEFVDTLNRYVEKHTNTKSDNGGEDSDDSD